VVEALLHTPRRTCKTHSNYKGNLTSTSACMRANAGQSSCQRKFWTVSSSVFLLRVGCWRDTIDVIVHWWPSRVNHHPCSRLRRVPSQFPGRKRDHPGCFYSYCSNITSLRTNRKKLADICTPACHLGWSRLTAPPNALLRCPTVLFGEHDLMFCGAAVVGNPKLAVSSHLQLPRVLRPRAGEREILQEDGNLSTEQGYR
jgi:hypothetical protein